MDKWNVTGIYTPIKRNEVYIDRCSNMDEPWKHAKWKKPVTKDSIQDDFIHMKYPEQAIYRENVLACLGYKCVHAWRGRKIVTKGYRVSFWSDKNVLKLTGDDWTALRIS